MANLPRAVRVLLYVLAAALIVVVLFEWVFPWVEMRMEDPTLEGLSPSRTLMFAVR